MSRPSHLKPDYSEFVEVDPTGRYVRYNEVLGRGATKTVYRAFDELEGIEVAWNQVKLYDYLQSPEDLERLYSEIHLLKTLKHKNIMKFHNSWVDTANRNINFVAEMFNSSLRQYRLKHRRVSIRTVKHWCRQILSGLVYLHSHDPPLIHRDLKCDNILINGNDGTVKIGDLGLAAILRKSHAARCVGTPEFMAPEVYEGEYNELADIYSFGMCILEMVTSEYPYSECADNAEIYKKVISGEKPDALYKVKDEEIKELVEKCLAPVSLRLSAMELLNDPFLHIDDSDSNLRLLVHSRDLIYRQPHFDLLDNSNSYINGHSDGDIHETQNEREHRRIEIESSGSGNFEMSIKGKRRDDGAIFLSLRVADKNGRIRKIYFPFDIKFDTVLNVASEMVVEVDSIDHDVTIIADMINAEISSLVAEWRAGQAKYSKRQFEQLENTNNETYDDAEPKPSQWNAMAGRKHQDSVTNNPLGCRPSVQSGLERGCASHQALSYLGNKPTIYLGVPFEAPTTTLHPVSARKPVSEQTASENLDRKCSADVDTNIKGKRRDDGGIFLRLRLADNKGRIRKIYFLFDVKHDTSLNVATEMVAELDSTGQDVAIIANVIDTEISSLVPEWKPAPAKYSQRLENSNNERHSHGGEKPSVWNVMALRKRQDSLTNNPLGLKPSVWSERGSVPRNVSSYPANNPTIHLGVSPKDLQAVPERERVSEQASLHLADKATNHLGVPPKAPTTATSQPVTRWASLRFRCFRKQR